MNPTLMNYEFQDYQRTIIAPNQSLIRGESSTYLVENDGRQVYNHGINKQKYERCCKGHCDI